MIELVDVHKSYQGRHGRLPVLRGVNARFERGDSVGILGVNGAGKSTLLRLIAGQERPNRGRIRRPASISWPLGFAGSFAGSLSGIENLRFVCRIYDVEIARVTEFVEDFAELGDHILEPVKNYSTGMKSRLAFALSMAIDFEVYIIDEALAVGDAAFQKKCQAAFEERRERSDVIMASHAPSMIRQYCNKAAVMNQGLLEVFDDIDHAEAYYGEISARRSRS